jgi:predicted permease
MRSLRAVLLRVVGLFRKARRDGELADEIASHVQMQIDDNLRAGMTPDEARRQALVRFGGVEAVKEAYRDRRSVPFLEATIVDLRYAARVLRRNPGFATVAAVTLALGIGANTAMFSVVHAVLLRPLPYPASDRLVGVWSTFPDATIGRGPSSLPDYRAWRAANRTFSEMGAYYTRDYNLTGLDRPERLEAAKVTASLWSVLGVAPRIGRVFGPEAERWGQHRSVVLSDALWQRHFGGDPGVIGRTVLLDGEAFTVTGVMPATFRFPAARTEIWTPVSFPPGDSMETRSNRFVNILARLKPGVGVAQADADMAVVAAQVSRGVSENAGMGVTLRSWQAEVVSDVRFVLLLLFGTVGFVALIACANVANLLLARSAVRRMELSVRAALGAGRRRLVRQLVTESVVLAALGGVLGWGIAYFLLRALPAVAPSGMPRLQEVSLNPTVAGFTGGLALATALIFGLWPAWHGARSDVGAALKESSRTASGGRSHARARNLLIVSEVSLSLVLLVGAGLLMLSLGRVRQVEPGFRPDSALTLRVTLPASRYATGDQIARFVDEALARISALPGVAAAGATTTLPLVAWDWGKFFSIEGGPVPASLAQVPNVNHRQVSPGYFRTLGATLRRGRFFTPDDRAGRPPVAIINETAAARFWPGEDPIGKRVRLGVPEALALRMIPKDYPGGMEGWRAAFPFLTIVGVIADLRQNGLERDANPEVFIPIAQAADETSPNLFLIARTIGDPLTYVSAIEAAVHRVDPNQPVADVRSMEQLLADTLAPRRFTLFLLGLFATIAIALTLVGLYGVMTYSVSQRRTELGIRAALGAQPRDLVSLLVGHGLRLAALGVAIGLVLAASLSRLLSTQLARMLFRVDAIDPVIYAAGALALLACAGLACWVPSRRASRLDPATTLRAG